MKKLTVLNLYKLDSAEINYAIIADLEGNRKTNSIDLFLENSYQFILCVKDDMPMLAMKCQESDDWAIAIEFYKRVNNHFFGRSHYNGKCIYGLYSHPWHKKVKETEFTLFESEVNFDDLFHFDFHEGKYVPDFSNKQNWMQAYHAQHPDNIHRSLDYAMNQPTQPDLQMVLDAMREKGLLID